MRVTDIPEIAQLSTPEKLLLIEDLWDSISGEINAIPVPQSHKEELDRRMKDYYQSPGKLLTLDQLLDKIG